MEPIAEVKLLKMLKTIDPFMIGFMIVIILIVYLVKFILLIKNKEKYIEQFKENNQSNSKIKITNLIWFIILLVLNTLLLVDNLLPKDENDIYFRPPMRYFIVILGILGWGIIKYTYLKIKCNLNINDFFKGLNTFQLVTFCLLSFVYYSGNVCKLC